MKVLSSLLNVGLGAVLAVGLVGCSDSVTNTASRVEAQSSAGSNGQGSTTLMTEERLYFDALAEVAHRGVRILRSWNSDGNGYAAVRDEIWTDGEGGFALKHLDALTDVVPKEPTYGFLKNFRQGFYFRYMMFRPRHQPAFARNWRITENGTGLTIAGRPCVEFQVKHRSATDLDWFLIAVDELNGLILREIRIGSNGLVRSKMEYEVVDLTPDLASVQLHIPLTEEVELDPSLGLDEQMGFEVQTPRLLPDHYRPIEVKSVSLAGAGRWIKIVYSDGIDTLFFLQHAPLERMASHEVVAAGNPPADPDEDLGEAGLIRFGEFGVISFVSLEVGSRTTYLMGRQSSDDLLDIAESTL